MSIQRPHSRLSLARPAARTRSSCWPLAELALLPVVGGYFAFAIDLRLSAIEYKDFNNSSAEHPIRSLPTSDLCQVVSSGEATFQPIVDESVLVTCFITIGKEVEKDWSHFFQTFDQMVCDVALRTCEIRGD